ncbi:unnamed protein product [Dicrocoelium dendriticum]|nr:unnamed protein product [Dicrocoelium dendriticum]
MDTKYFHRSVHLVLGFSLQPTTKCHLEFLEEAVLNRPYYIARINLLTLVERHATWTPTVEALWLANRLIWRGYSCTFPVQIRQEIATYVPSEAAAQGEDFEFRVTFVKSILRESQPTELSEGKYCNKIMELASGFIQVCYILELQQHHGIAHILVRRTNASFWEVQCQLMFTLNSHHPHGCRFNVEANSVPKHY